LVADAAIGDGTGRAVLRGVHVHGGFGSAIGKRERMDHKAIMQGVTVRIALSVFGLLTVAMLLLAIFDDKGAVGVYGQSLKLKAIQTENQSLESEIKNLNHDIDDLENNPAAIEKIAREKQGLVKPGEIILVLPNDSEPEKK
jgi:cell division protein FtsB